MLAKWSKEKLMTLLVRSAKSISYSPETEVIWQKHKLSILQLEHSPRSKIYTQDFWLTIKKTFIQINKKKFIVLEGTIKFPQRNGDIP